MPTDDFLFLGLRRRLPWLLTVGIFFACLANTPIHADPISELRRAIDKDYSYRDLHSVNWKKLFIEYTPRLQATKSSLDFAKVAADLLSHAKDVHITVQVDSTTLSTFQRSIPPNYDMTLIAKLVPDIQSDHRCVSFGRTPDGIGYVVLGSWLTVECLASAQQALNALSNEHALVVDVRPNSGGNELFAQQFAGRFIAAPTKYALIENRISGHFTPKQSKQFEPNPTLPHFRGKVVVLMGPHVISTSEAFLLMMRSAGATLIGAPSFGSSGNPLPHPLSNGVIVKLPSWRAYQLSGALIEGNGISPDISIAWINASKDDPILQAALAFLRK